MRFTPLLSRPRSDGGLRDNGVRGAAALEQVGSSPPLLHRACATDRDSINGVRGAAALEQVGIARILLLHMISRVRNRSSQLIDHNSRYLRDWFIFVVLFPPRRGLRACPFYIAFNRSVPPMIARNSGTSIARCPICIPPRAASGSRRIARGQLRGEEGVFRVAIGVAAVCGVDVAVRVRRRHAAAGAVAAVPREHLSDRGGARRRRTRGGGGGLKLCRRTHWQHVFFFKVFRFIFDLFYFSARARLAGGRGPVRPEVRHLGGIVGHGEVGGRLLAAATFKFVFGTGNFSSGARVKF